jgi:hypothetical protein
MINFVVASEAKQSILAICSYYSRSHDCAAALLFRTGPVEQVDWANLIAGCSGCSDRISPA